MRFSKAIQAIGSTFYQGIIRKLFKLLNIDNYILDISSTLSLYNTPNTYTQSVNGTSADFDIDSDLELNKIKSLDGEENVINDIIMEVKKGDVFYDIGANIGIYSCLIGDLIDIGKVIAIEPHPPSVNKLRKNIEMNNTNASVYQSALSSEKNKKRIIENKKNLGTGQITINDSQEKGVEVEVLPGDEFREIHGLPFPNIVKIDVEGEELQVIRGMENILRHDNCRLVYCEVHPNSAISYTEGLSEEDVQDLYDLVEKLGFSVREITSRNGQYFIKAEKTRGY